MEGGNLYGIDKMSRMRDETSDRAERCPHCGYPIKNHMQQTTYQQSVNYATYNPQDVPSTGLNVLAFLIPLVGLILYCVNLSIAPNKAKAIGKWALIGFIVGLVIVMLCSL